MTIVNDIRKTVTDTTPVYAVVGVTDLAVETLRDFRHELSIAVMQEKAVKRFEKVSEQAQHIPTQVRDQTTEVTDKAKETYSELAVRGEKLVKRIRNQKSTQNLFTQAGNTLSLGKGAVTTVRKAAHDTQHAAKVTLTTGLHEAESVVSSVEDDIKATGRSANKAAATTLASADETVTAAKKSTAAAQRATRSVSTSARKTASSASAAAKTATPKIGD